MNNGKDNKPQEEQDKPLSDNINYVEPPGLSNYDPQKQRLIVGRWTLFSCVLLLVFVIVLDTVFTLKGVLKSELLEKTFEFIKTVVLIVLGFIFSKDFEK